MFDLQREVYPENTMMLVRRETAGQKLEQKQRDIYDSHRHRIFAVAFYMSGNQLEAERVLTCTFVDAFHAAQEPDREQIDTALLAHLRRTFPLGQKETPASPSNGGPLGPSTVRRSDLEEAILYLPATERLVFLLTDVTIFPRGDLRASGDVPKRSPPDGLLRATPIATGDCFNHSTGGCRLRRSSHAKFLFDDAISGQ